MSKLNQEDAPNNNLTPGDIKSSKLVSNEDHEFSEELSDGGERNENIKEMDKFTKGVRLI
ncbi:hypothetical protein DS745_24070 [Anaerobacillus alkaliphilus]|uniref:Uncharacterized protein n=1 Tax=Anaerobacillus alkaliphilus TaxID=1548597 RepID=A0A4V1LFQ2_9BACI|nr:hypothetical protein [Anaerobacillus alkaliphilus]RXI95532.1 hypothetical protein DS745_24070 [Anaerobacillus alkaliphilus]